jgi:hypothetical protein
LRNVRIYILLLFVGITFFSCSKDEFEAQVPAYISIDKFTLTTNLATQGSASEGITDAWVYVDDNLVGVYELPAKFPVLKEGLHKLQVFAGIKANGISASRERYLFYSSHVEQVVFVKNETLNINPQISYIPETKFAWIEDFENAGLTFTYSNGSDTTINKSIVDVFEGNFSGRVLLTPTMDFFEAISPAINNVSIGSGTVYLELNFKTNEPILVGMFADTDKAGVIYLNTTTQWKKIYINMTDIISSKPNATNFQVFFGMSESVLVEFLTNNPQFYFDNIKLVHF